MHPRECNGKRCDKVHDIEFVKRSIENTNLKEVITNSFPFPLKAYAKRAGEGAVSELEEVKKRRCCPRISLCCDIEN